MLIDGFTSEMKSWSIGHLLNGSEHLHWVLDLEDEVHSIWLIGRSVAFKNARAVLFLEVGHSGQRFSVEI